jgi:hypothetical protein
MGSNEVSQKNLFGDNLTNSSKKLITKERKQGLILGLALGVLTNYVYDLIKGLLP